MKRGIVNSIILSGCAFLALGGCTRELDDIQGEGGEIEFAASTAWQNEEEETRTEYSGAFNTVSGNKYERIDWVSGKDRIRIYCAQSPNVSGTTNKYSDYVVIDPVTTVSGATEQSKAQITKAGQYALQWGSDTHYFYAVYPAPGTQWKYDTSQQVTTASITGASGNKATVTGSVPATQVVKWNSSQNEYEANMNYAYMYAAESVSAGSNVTLHFKPLVTTLQFTIKAADAYAQSDGLKLTGFKLKSTSSALSGNFTATLSTSSDPLISASGTPGSEISLSIATADQQTLTTSSTIKVTVFTLATATLDNLSIEMTFSDKNGTTRKRTLALKNNNANITVQPCCKAYINSLGVPAKAFTYTFGSLSGGTVNYKGGTVNVASGFKSSKTNGTSTYSVPYTLQYYYNNQWNNNPPSWITASSTMNTNGGTTGTSLSLTVKHQEDANDGHHSTLAGRTAKSNYDLSTLNVAKGTTVSQTTANCYVVTAPGTYKFPMVYGNALINGANNEDAYHARNGVGGTQRNSDATSAPYYLGYFKDHLGNDIKKPYLTTQLNKTYDKFEAFIIWQDEPDLITNVGINSSAEVTFSVPKETITQGNALIGVKVKADGKIAWSWHIWVTDADLTQCKQGPKCTHTNKQYYIAPLNVGWCDGHTGSRSYAARTCKVRVKQSETNTSREVTITQSSYTDSDVATGGNCPYYQWGRKDPLKASNGVAVNGWASSAKTIYGTQYAQIDSKKSIGDAIQNPTTHYSPAGTVNWYQDNWCTTDWLNLWSSTLNNTGYGEPDGGTAPIYSDTNQYPLRGNDSAKTKTIYDPSPVGFRVPTIDVWCELGPSVFPWGTEGRTYNSNLFFPAAGQRAASDGGVGYIGYRGYYWAANVYEAGGSNKQYCGYNLYFNNGSGVYTWNPSYSANRFANGYPVRPVKE